MDVVLYLRYSTGPQQTEQSIEGQHRVCKAFCDAHDMNIVDVYIDRKTSASKNTDKRTEFQKMIKDSDKRLWQAVVVYKLDRFARNRYDSATYKARLKKNGVKVISATENISDNPEGIILEAVLEGMAEFYSKELSQKILRGMYESALKCNSCGGQLCLGYKIENKKLVIDPLTAPIVKQAFALYAKGMTIAEICEKFNQLGYKTKKGVAFNKNSFKSMFKNEKYIGVYKYMDIKIEDGVPAIVDKELFEEVQKRLKVNSTAPSRGKAITDYLLSGKLFCGHCEGQMTGAASTSHTGRKFFYYTCSNRKRFHNCTKSHIRKEFIERAVVEDTMSILTPEYIEELADMAIRANNDEIKFHTLIPSLEEKIKEIENAITNLLKLAESGAISPTLSNRLTELEKEKSITEKRLLKEKSEIVILEKEHIIYWLSQFLHGDITDMKFQRHVIDMLIKTVYVWDNADDPDSTDVFITYNLTPKKTVKLTIKDIRKSASLSGADYTPMVEMRGVEPLSKKRATILSTYLLRIYLSTFNAYARAFTAQGSRFSTR